MKDERAKKSLYEEPMVLATYSKEDLEETIKPHGSVDSYTGGSEPGCSCGCACSTG